MNTVKHSADSRGVADHGWLKSQHSFSFASYYNPKRMGFGFLRVINDDRVAPAKGFGTHPHENMEIISIPLTGALEHKDSEGNQTIIRHGEVQIMSAGTGVQHSEYNASSTEEVNFLQIWILPQNQNIAPRYAQQKFPKADRQNKLQIVVSPMGLDAGGIEINQNAYLSLADLTKGNKLSYPIHLKPNGVYVFVLEGEIAVGQEKLGKRDAIGVTDASMAEIQAITDANILLIEVPLA